MFGVLRGASCTMRPAERAQWMNHICGVCLALRDNAGQAARITTNYDAALISVLCEAQAERPANTYTSRCPLRGQRFTAEVVAPDSAGAQYAAAIALTAGATKVADHVEDGDSFLRHIPWISGGVAHSWQMHGRRLAQRLGFDTGLIHTQTGRQAAVEATAARDFLYYAQPTELAVAAAFGHTAVIADRPHNADVLYDLGRQFGRIMYLLDSYRDYADDVAQGKFNALAATAGPERMQVIAQDLFHTAFRSIKSLFGQLDLPQPDLARKLLVSQLKQIGYKTLDIARVSCAACSCRTPLDAAEQTTGWLKRLLPTGRQMRRRRRNTKGCCEGCCDCLICCDCGTDCCCFGCCDFDMCECDEGACEMCECSLCCCEGECCQCGDGCCCCDCDCGNCDCCGCD